MAERSGSMRRLIGLAAPSLALLAAAATASAAPTISGTDDDVWNGGSPEVSYTLTAQSSSPFAAFIRWEVDGVARGQGFSPVVVTLPRLADGEYDLRAEDRSGDSDREFRVDRTPPAVTITSPAAGSRFLLGAVVRAAFSCTGAVSCVGPVALGAPIYTGAEGAYILSVRATDQAGNAAQADAAFSVVANPAPPPSGGAVFSPGPVTGGNAGRATTTTLPRTLNAARLRPSVRSSIRTRRPVLRWRARPGTDLYNVQIFRVRAGKLTKVVSLFPKANRLRVPRGRVAWSTHYVWRVWPFDAGRYTKKPLGISNFRTTAKPR